MRFTKDSHRCFWGGLPFLCSKVTISFFLYLFLVLLCGGQDRFEHKTTTPQAYGCMEYGSKYLKYKGRIVFGKQAMPFFDRMPKEYAENEACFVFVNQGAVSVRAPEQYFDLDNRSGILAKCLNYFFETREAQRRKGEGIEVIAVLLYPALIKEIFDFNLADSNFSFGYNIKQVAVDSLLENFKQGINILLDNPELADENIIKAKVREFVLLICKSQNFPSQLDFLAALFQPVNISFRSTIQRNLYANLSVDELARLCHLSTSSFKRTFQAEFGESPKRYITRKKIEKAASLLKSSTLRVSAIAYDVGFESITTFNRLFTDAYGVSPTQFRT